MANPVWVLSVDLQTKTATFQSGMADAARSARTAFKDIGGSSVEMGERVEKSTLDIRHSLGLVDNVIRGAHAQAMADMIRLFQRSAIVMTALPFAAVVAGFALVAGIVYEVHSKIAEYRAEQEKLGNDMTALGTVGQNAFNALADKILEAEKRADDLRNNSIGALSKELQLIDRQSFTELIKSFQTLDKAADEVFGDLKNHWYSLGIGADGAKHALTQFQVQYESLLSQGKDKDAGDLLKGTRDSAAAILADMKAAAGSRSSGGAWGPSVDYTAQYRARVELQKAGVGYTDKEMQAQAALVQTLNSQLSAQAQINQLKKDDEDNAKRSTSNTLSAQSSAGARAAIESQLRTAQLAIEADKETANAQLTVKRASVEARLAVDIDFAARDRDAQLAANTQEIAALDRSAKDYQNALKALKEKQLEIAQQYATATASATAKATVEAAARDLATTEESIRESIEATRRGSAARIAAIEAGMQQERALGLQDTDSYRQLETQRIETIRQSAEEERTITAEAAKEEADNTEKMGMLALEAEKQTAALVNSSRRMTAQARIDQDIKFASQEYGILLTGLSHQIAGLDQSSKDYDNKLQALLNKQLQLYTEHENQVTAIRQKAEEDRNQRILSAEDQFDNRIAQGLTQVIEGHKTFSSMMQSIGNEVVTGMIQNMIKMALTQKTQQFHDAAAAASSTYAQVAAWPVVGPFLAPELAAAAFAGVMAFEGGGIVPGVGHGDIVPARLEPGEGVVPGGVMAGLSAMARAGKMTGGTTHHMHYNPTFHLHAIDATGIRQMLRTHTDEFESHYHNIVRKMNR